MGTPLLVQGVVRDKYGKIEINAKIVFSYGNASDTVYSDAVGHYIYDLSNLCDDGESVAVSVKNASETQSYSGSITASSTPQTSNIDLVVITTATHATGYPIKTILTNVNGLAINEDNRLPIEAQQEDFETRQSYTSAGLVEYIGLAAPGTADSEAKWKIKKQVYVNSRVTEIRWANRTKAYDKSWNDKASYDYSY